MSTKAINISRSASLRADDSMRRSIQARAMAEAEKAEQAACAAIKAALEARAAAGAGDVERAAKAANAAVAARNGADSATMLVKVFADKDEPAKRGSRARIDEAVDRSAHYLVTYNGQLVASFLREDDALLFEAELADLDRAHGVESALCEVRSRRGQRLGGYLLTAGKLLSFLRDRDYARHFGRAGRP